MLPFEKITPAFIPVLAKIHEMCFEKSWDEKSFSTLLSLPTTQGFLSQDGLILCSVCQDEAEILTLCVLPSARRKKVGTSLLSSLFSSLQEQKVKTIFLDVNVENKAAIALYLKNGFEQIAVRKGYYNEGTKKYDALIFKKNL